VDGAVGVVEREEEEEGVVEAAFEERDSRAMVAEREGTGGIAGGGDDDVEIPTLLSRSSTSSMSLTAAFARRCSAIVSRRWTPALRETLAATESV
jgi:hypothetical protein